MTEIFFIFNDNKKKIYFLYIINEIICIVNKFFNHSYHFMCMYQAFNQSAENELKLPYDSIVKALHWNLFLAMFPHWLIILAIVFGMHIKIPNHF